ncbi:hypothetical protein [Methanogenium organophilum]|uniref:Uncharacterized protein n=1 Tax=Methanogenium organophilum TaxID=2199 RepID=A0A9X9S359_METOG|nr:hypothetical protein [Methanogenium organophilum]WAI00637.1 hypothetical protein OU421_09400 [Methanogenium organophilum]
MLNNKREYRYATLVTVYAVYFAASQILAKNSIGFLDTPWFVWYKKMLEKGPVAYDI